MPRDPNTSSVTHHFWPTFRSPEYVDSGKNFIVQQNCKYPCVIWFEFSNKILWSNWKSVSLPGCFHWSVMSSLKSRGSSRSQISALNKFSYFDRQDIFVCVMITCYNITINILHFHIHPFIGRWEQNSTEFRCFSTQTSIWLQCWVFMAQFWMLFHWTKYIQFVLEKSLLGKQIAIKYPCCLWCAVL